MSINHISVKNITVGYNNIPVIKGVSFDVKGGEFAALLGLNGSGKTTLLKGICGLIDVMQGSCLLNDADLLRLNEKERARYISFIPQRLSRLADVTVLDAVLMGKYAHLGFFDSHTDKDKEEAYIALGKMEAAHLAGDVFSQLSEGQKQLVILSRTLLQDTPVMLMDEPDASLDFLNKHMMLGKVRDIVHSGNKACIVTLHDPFMALKYCDKIILIIDSTNMLILDLKSISRGEAMQGLSVVYGEFL